MLYCSALDVRPVVHQKLDVSKLAVLSISCNDLLQSFCDISYCINGNNVSLSKYTLYVKLNLLRSTIYSGTLYLILFFNSHLFF